MPRTTKPLNATEISKAKTKDKDYKLADGQGLYLLVKSTGIKLWRFNYVKPVTNKRTDISLGIYPEVTLADARRRKEEYRTLLAQGIDPQIHRNQQKADITAQIENSFLSVANKWKEKKTKEIEPLTLQKNWRRLEIYAFPFLANMPVADILPNLVIKSLEPLNQQNKGDTLKRVIRLINEILTYAVNSGLLPFNPCLNVNEVFNFGQSESHPTIRPEELPTLLFKIHNSKLTLFTRCLIKFQLLTMVRPSEASNVECSEIDLNQKLWTIPAKRMKKRNEHIVPLSTQALEILNVMQQFNGNKQYVFQSARNPHKPMNSQTVNKALIDLGYKNKLDGHGLRAIASTYLNEYEPFISPDVIEACLSHGIKDRVRRAYNRSNYLEQRKSVMQLWSEYIEKSTPKI
ncbi:integrase arm-type DNA-binding domain-containing protein [Lonepinella sp. BR2474]|uniref:integrase arm-type DNA-binding domain-containing protein n=1 Tax=Lonepinella sp. BR2474 TaxID=3434548 RepID=UPI003F6DE0D3